MGSYEHTRALNGVNLSAQQAWSQIDDLRYTRDPAGNITKIVNTQGSVANGAPTRTQCFDYDALNRLTQAWTATDSCAGDPSTATVGGVNPYWTSWDINEIGLRDAETRHAVSGGANTTTSYTYPPSGPDAVRPHALSGTTTQGPLGTSSANYGYNVAGDVTSRDLPTGDQTLTWNENKRLDTVTTTAGTTSYVYDADGGQLIRRDPVTTTLYLPMQDIVRDNTTGTLKGTRYYTHNGATVAMRVGGGNPQYLQNDQHGTAQVAVSTPAPGTSEFAATRRTFDPYGNPIGTGHSLWPDDRGFLNKPHNPVTGLTDIGARKYDPTTGTFVSVDPVLDTQNPQQWNPYAYSNNNPITYSDPSGLYCDGCNFQNHQMNRDGPEVGVGCPPCHNDPGQAQREYEIRTGQNRDPKKQPKFGGRRIPTFEELKNRPGYAHYMVSGTYDEAISDWAKDICARPVPEDAGFCSTASAHGLLEVSPESKQLAMLIGIGVVLAPIMAECLASALCLRIAGGTADAISPEGAAFASAASGSAGAAKVLDILTDGGRAACSFTGDTTVLMADGTRKPIENVDIGDVVVALDAKTGDRVARRVSATIVHEDVVEDLVLEDGQRIGTTRDHPFWNVTDSDWQPAARLDARDELAVADGRRLRGVGFDARTTRIVTVYNLTVETTHTYFVGDDPVAVHNSCPELFYNKFPNDKPDWARTFDPKVLQNRSGKFNYVVTEDGSLILGRASDGHINLAGGAPVQAAGNVKIRSGRIQEITNLSGHYKPQGSNAENAAVKAFNDAGFDATGKYVNHTFPR